MKVKLAEIIDGVPSLNILAETKFPTKVAYRIKRLTDKLNPMLKTYEEKRVELVKEYGTEVESEKGEKSTQVTDSEKIPVFLEKLNELRAVEEDVDFEPISVKELGAVEVAPKDLLSWIFTD